MWKKTGERAKLCGLAGSSCGQGRMVASQTGCLQPYMWICPASLCPIVWTVSQLRPS